MLTIAKNVFKKLVWARLLILSAPKCLVLILNIFFFTLNNFPKFSNILWDFYVFFYLIHLITSNNHNNNNNSNNKTPKKIRKCNTKNQQKIEKNNAKKQ